MHAQRMYTKWTRNFRDIFRMIAIIWECSGVLAPGRLHIPQERFPRIVMRLRLPFILSTLLRGPDVIRQVHPSKFLRIIIEWYVWQRFRRNSALAGLSGTSGRGRASLPREAG